MTKRVCTYLYGWAELIDGLSCVLTFGFWRTGLYMALADWELRRWTRARMK